MLSLRKDQAVKDLLQWSKSSVLIKLGTRKPAPKDLFEGAVLVIGRKGAGKSGLLSTMAVQLFASHVAHNLRKSSVPGGTLIVDLMDACDGENLFWLLLAKPFIFRPWRKSRVILVTGKNKLLTGSHVLYTDQVSWEDFDHKLVEEYLLDKKAVVVVNATITMERDELYDAVTHILEELRKINISLLWKAFIIVRELARLIPSRYTVSEKQRQTKKSLVHLLAELRHLKMSIGMDVQSHKMIDSVVLDIGADTLVLKPLELGQIMYLRKHPFFKPYLEALQMYVTTGVPVEYILMKLKPQTFIAFRSGDIYIGANALPPYYMPGHELVQKLNVKIMTGEELQEKLKEIEKKTT